MVAQILDLTLLIHLAIIIIVATLMGFLAKKFKQPTLIAYILTGLVIGQVGLPFINDLLGGLSLSVPLNNNIKILSELGIAFLLFSIGAETDFSKMFSLRKTLFVGGLAQVLLTFGLGYVLCTFLGLNSITATYIGFILAFSSTTIVVKLLSDKHSLDTLHGRLMIGFLLVQDIIIILLLPMLQSFQTDLNVGIFITIVAKGAILFGIGYLLNKFLLRRAVDFALKKSSELFFLTTLSIAFAFIGLASWLDFSIAVGAFVGGLTLANLPYNLEMISKIKGLRDFFATIFFVTLGMQITMNFTQLNLSLIIVMFLVVLLIKPIIFFFATFLSGYGTAIAFTVGTGLAQVSEFSFILLSQGYAGGTGPIPETIFSHTILVIALSMALSPYFMNYSSKAYKMLEAPLRNIKPVYRFFNKKSALKGLQNIPKAIEDHTIIVGTGALGIGIIETLDKDHSIIAIDNNPEIINNLIKRNFNAMYGSADNDELWEKVNLRKADLLIITLPEIIPTMRLVELSKRINPELTIFARAHYPKDALKLYKMGVNYVVIPEVIASNIFIKQVSKFFEDGHAEMSALKDEFYHYLEEKSSEKKKLYKL